MRAITFFLFHHGWIFTTRNAACAETTEMQYTKLSKGQISLGTYHKYLILLFVKFSAKYTRKRFLIQCKYNLFFRKVIIFIKDLNFLIMKGPIYFLFRAMSIITAEIS